MDVVQVASRRDPYDAVWDLLTSIWLAIAIIIALAATALVGSLLIQPVQTVDPRLLSDPAQHQAFLAFAKARYGFLAGVTAPAALRDATVGAMDAVGLFDVFNAPWFRVLLLVLAANVTVCTIDRLEPVWRTLRRPLVRRSDYHFVAARSRRAFGPVPLEQVASVLRARGYTVRAERAGETTYVHGDRNALARAGTLASHLALLILIVSGAVGALFGFREDLSIPDGGSLPVFPVGATNNVTVRNEGFVATFRDDGTPADFYSDLALVRNGREVARQRVRVNDPLRYADLSFHQASFGPAVDVEVRDAATGNVVLSEAVRFFDTLEGVPVDVRPIGGSGERLFLALPPRDRPFLAAQVLKGEAPLGIGTFEPGESKRLGDYTLSFRGMTRYTVIRVVRNAGEPLLWTASALFLCGLLVTFYRPRSRVWLRLREDGAALTGIADRTFDLETELDTLVASLRTR